MNCWVICLSDAGVLLRAGDKTCTHRALSHVTDVQNGVHHEGMQNRRVDRNGGSKIEGNGTSAPLRHCLHIGFHGTRIFQSVPSNT
jgi:hypothetical protein